MANNITSYKHNYKLTEEDKKSIVLEYTLNRTKTTIDSICKKYCISEQTIYNVLNSYNQKEKQEIIDDSIKEYRKNFSKNANLIISKALNRLNNEIDNADNINLNQLSTTIGILYDKTRLEDNLSTSNNSININIKID